MTPTLKLPSLPTAIPLQPEWWNVIDPTITIGNIIEISVIVVGGVVAFIHVKSSVKNLGTQVDEMKSDIKGLNKSFTELAVVNNRLTNAEDDIRELRHGRGFIRSSLEGEYPKSPFTGG